VSGNFLTDDLSILLNTDDFADADSITHAGVTTPITGIIDDGFKAVEQVESCAPSFGCKSSDVDAIGVAHRDILTHTDPGGVATDYYIQGIQPDGTGWTTLMLSKD